MANYPGPGFEAIAKAAAKKRDAGGTVANALQKSSVSSGGNSGPDSSSRSNAIARRLAKGSSKSGPPKNDNDGDEQESGA